MIRPFTCMTLVAACGAGLYLYQVKHRAQMVDRDITRTVKLTEQTRDRISLLKTELANLTTPARLSSLAAEHLRLEPTQPAQYVRLEDLRSRLPPITPPSASPPPVDEAPIAAATLPAPAKPSLPLLAMIQTPPAPAAAKQVTPVAVRPISSVALPASVPAVVNPPPAVVPVQLAAAHPVAKPMHRELVSKDQAVHEPAAREAVAPAPHRLFAPVMPAYAPVPVIVHAPTVQTASATLSQSSPFLGSALGMARTALAAPVPVPVQAGYPAGQ